MLRSVSLFVVVVVVAFHAADAAACQCLEPDDTQHLLDTADLAFAGRVVDVDPYVADEFDDAPCFVGGQGATVVVVEVDRVWKGDVAERVSLLSILGGGSSCSLDPRVGDERVFFTRDSDGDGALSTAVPQADICTTPNVVADDVDALAPARAPRAGSDDRAGVCRRPPPDDDDDTAPSCAQAPASALLASLALLLRRRR